MIKESENIVFIGIPITHDVWRLHRRATELGARVAYIGNVRVESIEKSANISIVYKGNNTNVDITIAQILLNYIGNCLRNKIIN